MGNPDNQLADPSGRQDVNAGLDRCAALEPLTHQRCALRAGHVGNHELTVRAGGALPQRLMWSDRAARRG